MQKIRCLLGSMSGSDVGDVHNSTPRCDPPGGKRDSRSKSGAMSATFVDTFWIVHANLRCFFSMPPCLTSDNQPCLISTPLCCAVSAPRLNLLNDWYQHWPPILPCNFKMISLKFLRYSCRRRHVMLVGFFFSSLANALIVGVTQVSYMCMFTMWLGM